MGILPPIDPTIPVSAYDPSQALHTPSGVLPPILSGDTVSPGSDSTGDDLAKRGLLSHALGKEIFRAEKPPEPSAPLGTPEYFQQRGQQLNYDKEHPWGSAISEHPGVLGKIFHGLAKAGNIAGDIVAPGTMSLIPGTDLNKTLQERENQSDIVKSEQLQNQTTEANAAGQNADTEHDKEKLAEQQAGQPKPKEEKWGAFDKYTDTDGTPLIHEENSGQVVRADNHQPPKGFKAADNMQTREITRVVNGVPHTVMVDARTGADVKDEGQTKIPDTGGKADARSDKSYQYNQGRLDKIRQPIDGLVSRFSRLQDTLNQKNPQADALVAPEMLTIMAGGQGSGLRMNEAEISRMVGGRSAWENLKASMQHWATDPTAARSITPAQDQQIRALIGLVGQKLTQKQSMVEQAQEQLLGSDDPKEHRQIMADAQKKLDAIDGGQITQEPTRPANVPDGYVFKDGPKGKGWYKP